MKKVETPQELEFKDQIDKRVKEYDTPEKAIIEISRVLYYITELNHHLWHLERTEENSVKDQEEKNSHSSQKNSKQVEAE